MKITSAAASKIVRAAKILAVGGNPSDHKSGYQEGSMPVEKFDFHNGDGHQLAALLDLPDASVRAVALFAHCFTCGKDKQRLKPLSIHIRARTTSRCGSAVGWWRRRNRRPKTEVVPVV
jgi:hypothetical protein